ncbi:SDR family oxidoreductase [Gordonia sp. NB41Y]|uniref:SDR family oxidoreductase n=1 Tax=Gordonia sp. NB41Y TaxID=875808 RepID=UPI0006B1BE4A|nr:SDR family oxidoreductase [Gordonia sp. NB41Y]EMP15024.2 NAD-dependent epimerase [Gordonia sp. NB41Y]WLP92414.1 SDR family oxidoreductase [Gordonia sp. NB41Y]
MGTYVVTGSASGMGQSVADALREQGHTVIGVDRDGGEVTADLSTASGRRAAITEILDLLDGRIDGVVLAAGLGPARGRERTIIEVNLLGVVEVLEALRPLLAAADKAKVVVFGSNSTTATPFVPPRLIRRLLRGDLDAATAMIRRRGPQLSGPIAYASSKIAVTRWSRMVGTSADWAGAGIRVNVIAPGPVMTPLLRTQLDGANSANVRSFPIPIREYGTSEQLASWVMQMLSPAADFMSGTVITVDGGTEALLRGADWPRPVPLHRVPAVLWRMYRAPKKGQVARY